ncbi:MAG: Helix-turn-helix domain [Candidatus Acidoferrum typicum]|nr:Helix-turn-helix domain [Candidatus Acidoferrum typicum]
MPKGNFESTHRLGLIPRLLKPEEAAQALRISEDTLSAWRYLPSCPLRFIRLGRSVRYREDDIIKFLEASAAAPRCIKPPSRTKNDTPIAKAAKTA